MTTRAPQEPGWDANGSPVLETPEQTAEWEAAQRRAPLIAVYGIYDTGHHELLGHAPFDTKL